MRNEDRLREAVEEHLRQLEAGGQSRGEAATELAMLAEQIAAEGDADWANVLISVSRADQLRAQELAYSDSCHR
jgi:hypothetical protein